jgi:hypothetical protein
MTQQSNVTRDIPAGFIRIADVFRAAEVQAMKKSPSMVYERVPETWFPEIPALEWADTSKVMSEGRLKARELTYVSDDGYRYTLVLTLWFDEKPFAIVQEGGRSGRDYRRRIVSDKAILGEAAAYVIQNMVSSTQPDGNTLTLEADDILPVEEIFDFYSQGTAESLGYQVANPRRDLYDYAGDSREQHLKGILQRDEVLIVAMGVAPAEYLRSGGTYYAFQRQLADKEIATVPHLDSFRDAMAENALKESKVPTLLVYRKTGERPASVADAIPL